jgi:hypothetical protein
MKSKIWFSVVTFADAKALCRWWNAYGSITKRYCYERSVANPKFFDVIEKDYK